MSKKRIELWHGIVPKEKQINEQHSYTEDTNSKETFHLSDVHNMERCIICGGVEFNVGTGDYFTAIRCVKCQWEQCAHSG